MVFGFGLGLGQRRRRIPEDPSLVARAEVKFWKTELDRCVQEKQHWIARAENAHKQNEVLRTEVHLLQQDVRQLQEVLSLPGASKPSSSLGTQGLQPPHHHHRDHQNPSHHQTPSRSSRTHRGVPVAVPQVQTSRQLPSSGRPPQPQLQPPPPQVPATPEAAAPEEDDEFVDFTPAAKRFQSPVGPAVAAGSSSSNSRPAQAVQDEAARWRDEANSLRKYLQEARSLNESLRQQLTQQQHRGEFLRSIAEEHKKEAEKLQHKLLTSHGLNDETADETVKLLAELGRAQQSNALLKRDLKLKDDLIQLLREQVAELSSQLPLSPRSARGRSPERTTFSASACSHSPDGHASPRLHDHAPLRAACADVVAGGGSSDDAYLASTASHSIDSYAFHHHHHHLDDALDYLHHTAVDAHALPLTSASPARSRLSLSSRPHSLPHSRPRSARPSRGTDIDLPNLPPDAETDLELAGLVAVHAAMYRHEKEALRQSQQQLDAALAATRYEVAAHETGFEQVLDGLTSERLNAMAARWKPPKPRTRSWREPEGQDIDPMLLLVPGAKLPCSCGDDCEEHPMGLGGGADGSSSMPPQLRGTAQGGSLGAAASSTAQGGKAASGKAAAAAGADKGAAARGSGAATRAPARAHLGGRLAKDSAFSMAGLAHAEQQQPLAVERSVAAKPTSQFAAARCALERKTSPVFDGLEKACRQAPDEASAQRHCGDAGQP